jgi:hypothetical protein
MHRYAHLVVDRVSSEPLSGEFPLTGNKTEKFWAFVSKHPQEDLLSPLDIQDLRQSGPIRARSEQGIID